MAVDVPRIAQLLQASLDPQQNKQGESLPRRTRTAATTIVAARDEKR